MLAVSSGFSLAQWLLRTALLGEIINLGFILRSHVLTFAQASLFGRVVSALAAPTSVIAFLSVVLILTSPVLSFAQGDSLREVRSLIAIDDYDTALEKLDGFLASQPSHPQARFLKGIIFTARDQTDAAIDVFVQLADEYPNLP